MSKRQMENSLALLRGMAPTAGVKSRRRGLTVSQFRAIRWAINAIERVSENYCGDSDERILYCNCESCMAEEKRALQERHGPRRPPRSKP